MQNFPMPAPSRANSLNELLLTAFKPGEVAITTLAIIKDYRWIHRNSPAHPEITATIIMANIRRFFCCLGTQSHRAPANPSSSARLF